MEKVAVKRRETKNARRLFHVKQRFALPLPAVIMKRGVNPLGGW